MTSDFSVNVGTSLALRSAIAATDCSPTLSWNGMGVGIVVTSDFNVLFTRADRDLV